LKFRVIAQAPIERVEIRNGSEVVETIRGYGAADLGARIRVIWAGAEYRGRGRDTHWIGRARFDGASITRMEKINAWNHERRLECQSHDTVLWEAITTGNYGGFDAWLAEKEGASLDVVTNHGSMSLDLAEIGIEDRILEAGGLARQIRIFRLPETNPHKELSAEIDLPLKDQGDNPLWVCVTTEDGFQAWSSPIYAFRE
jgi:hypothetical protein